MNLKMNKLIVNNPSGSLGLTASIVNYAPAFPNFQNSFGY